MNTSKNFTIKRILNNSSLVGSDSISEIVIMGKGIGFGYKAGDVLPQGTPYDKAYKLSNQTNEFNRIINGFDDEIVAMVMDTIQLISEYGVNKFTTPDLITLADHLAATYTRIIKDEAINSFFSHEIRALYPDAYEKSKTLCSSISEKYSIIIPDAEVSYIALHIQNISDKLTRENLDKLNGIVWEIEQLITKKYELELNKDTVHYSRFLTHIRFIIESALSNKKALNEQVNTLLISSYKKQAEIAEDIIGIIEKEMNIHMEKEELAYIVIHLVNIIGEIE
ncbi:PRD domain-containing protein [Erysipelothrix sp. HDW6C]|uniref:PRD domain-containing protein n=1 Tax=Erysipelothrix sp. HDW6C TaxID=2714930 RepID=UPI0014074023|nr:PRD domain-containing protein [Erysipelothrix sp. HDW6C]QIK68941.1 PRD domain-containing protein [Erysipelothrix sp. HDW6C]